MKNKSSAFYLLLIISIFSLTLSSCGPKVQNNDITESLKPSAANTIKTPAPAETEKVGDGGRDANYITATEAAALGYTKAAELYSDAVLSSISTGTSLATHYDWKNTGLTYNWTVTFLSPSASKLIYVYINGGEVNSVNVNDKSNVAKELNFPKDKPLMTMVDAIKVVDANGGITGFRPNDIEYRIDGYYENDFPWWGFGYKIPLGGENYERHFYYVNAVTGEFAEVKYKNAENDIIEKTELVVQDNDLSYLASSQDQRFTIIKFLTLINENSIDKAVDMMDDYAVPNKSSRDMWIESLSTIRGMKFLQGGFLLNDEDNWTDDTQRFKVKVSIPEGQNSEQFGWDSGENQRFFTLVKIDGEWKIHEISTGF